MDKNKDSRDKSRIYLLWGAVLGIGTSMLTLSIISIFTIFSEIIYDKITFAIGGIALTMASLCSLSILSKEKTR